LILSVKKGDLGLGKKVASGRSWGKDTNLADRNNKDPTVRPKGSSAREGREKKNRKSIRGVDISTTAAQGADSIRKATIVD